MLTATRNLFLVGFILLLLSFIPQHLSAQLICDGGKGLNLFTNYENGTFGEGIPLNKGPISGTKYTYFPLNSGKPQAGEYTVANSTDYDGNGGKVFGTWQVIGDHTGAVDPLQGNPPPKPGTKAGYMLVVNASYAKDIAVTDSIRNLCPDQEYEFAAWIRVLNIQGEPNNKKYIVPNLVFMINGKDAHTTGPIDEIPWKNIGFKFKVPANQKAIQVAVRNEAGGGDGNDWALDDITVNTCNTSIKVKAKEAIHVCEGASITLRDTVLSTGTSTFPYYKWQKSTDGGKTWTEEGGVKTETTNPKNYVITFPTFVATKDMNDYLFRVIVANAEPVLTNNDVCYYSAVKTTRLFVHPQPVIKVAPATICAGDTATLVATIITGPVDKFKWTPSSTLSSDTARTVKAFPKTTTTYTVIAKTEAGCNDTAEVTVDIKDIVADAGPDQYLCPNESVQLNATGGTKYSWRPAAGLSDTTIANPIAKPKVKTTYTVTVRSGACVDEDEVTVDLNPPINLVTSVKPPKCAGGNDGEASVEASGGSSPYEYLWTPGSGSASTIQSTPGDYTVIVTDHHGCKDTAKATIPDVEPISGLTSTITSNCNKPDGSASVDSLWGGTPPYSYSWDTNPVQTTQTAKGITSGNYNVTITDSKGCTVILTAVVPATPGITAKTTSTNVHCYKGSDGTATVKGYDGVEPYSYVWSNGQTTDSIGNLTAGTYTVAVTDKRDCPALNIVTITEPTQILVTAKDVDICPAVSVQLQAIGSGGTGKLTYQWNPDGLTGEIVTVSPAATTTYSIVATDENKCTGETALTVTVHPNPTISVASDTICFGTTTQLKASGAQVYNWAPATGLDATVGTVVTAGPPVTTTYTITGTDQYGCKGTTTAQLAIIPAPTILTAGGNACPGDTIQLHASGGVSYTWEPATGLNQTTGNMVIAILQSTATYTVTGTGPNGCTSTNAVVATVDPVPQAGISFSPNPASIFYPTIYFTDISAGNPISWLWHFGDVRNSTSIKQHPYFTYPDTIKDYNVKLNISNIYGCLDSTTIVIHIRGEFSFYIENTFTPNGDGINEGFRPKGTGIDESDYGFWIFDRWDNLIFKTNHWGDFWDGRANNGEEIAQIDTYVWKVRVRERDTKTVHNYVGHVNLVK